MVRWRKSLPTLPSAPSTVARTSTQLAHFIDRRQPFSLLPTPRFVLILCIPASTLTRGDDPFYASEKGRIFYDRKRLYLVNKGLVYVRERKFR